MKLLKRAFNRGFTLVELMVVVAIIGILSAVAIPNFKKYQSKAKTTEAKLQLSSLYTGMTSWFADYSTYSTCLEIMGYDPRGEYRARYYTTGFAAGDTALNSNAVNVGAPTACSAATKCYDTETSCYVFNAGKPLAGTLTTDADLAAQEANAIVDAAGFTAGAIGIISSDNTTAATADRWTINDGKFLRVSNPGY